MPGSSSIECGLHILDAPSAHKLHLYSSWILLCTTIQRAQTLYVSHHDHEPRYSSANEAIALLSQYEET